MFQTTDRRERNVLRVIGATAFTTLLFLTAFAAAAFAQDEHAKLDRSMLPASGKSVNEFVPKGWKIEEKVTGDLNGDGKADTVLKLIEDKPPAKDDMVVDKGRAMVVLLAGDAGAFRLAAVTDKLLQCSACGGAFYGVMDAPANVKIEKGVIIVNQDHGSREVSEMTFRFRYDEQPSMFILIGFDYNERDRAEGGSASESTNYLTGSRITTSGKGKRMTTEKTTVKKSRFSLEEVDADKFEEEASARLGG